MHLNDEAVHRGGAEWDSVFRNGHGEQRKLFLMLLPV